MVKNGPKISLDGVSRVKRVGRNGSPGLNFMVSMDNAAVSRSAADIAMKVARKDDSVYGFHVSDGSAASNETCKYMKEELLKAENAGNMATGRMVSVPLGRGTSIIREIGDFSDFKKIDIMVMGSMELSKPGSDQRLGSVSMAVSKASSAHVMVVKKYAHT